MFTVEERDRLRLQLLARAEADETIVGAAFTGSHAVGESDGWSDTDLVLAIRGETLWLLVSGEHVDQALG